MSPDTKFKNLPRLYIDQPLGQGCIATLEIEHVHYLRNVLRREAGDHLRLFNGHDGEWVYELSNLSKKKGAAAAISVLREQPAPEDDLILIFAPLKKPETDLVIQKATELGVTQIYPVIMDHSNTRKIRADRLENIIREAAEQSEGLSLPKLHNMQSLPDCLAAVTGATKIYVALERQEDQQSVKDWPASTGARGVIIGPEGGFSEEERRRFLDAKQITPLSLGNRVLRAETAAIAALTLLQFQP